ncbi:MAG: SDR family oxidoreductase [Hyphomonadaceae bacterium]
MTSSEPRFAGKVIMITGTASGIGLAAALRLAGEGARIVAVDRDPLGLEVLAGQIGKQCAVVVGDVAEASTLVRAFDTAAQQFGGLHGLVNNAGVAGPTGPFQTIAPEAFDRMVAINLKPVWRAMQLAHRPMTTNGGGAIVNVSSMAGLRPNRNHALYGMTKAAVISLTEHAAMDYAADGIRVNCLCPGPVDTPIFGQLESTLGADVYQKTRKRLTQRTVMNRFGTSDEQASAIAYLLSDEASFITGIAMPVDGGWSISDGRA